MPAARERRHILPDCSFAQPPRNTSGRFYNDRQKSETLAGLAITLASAGLILLMACAAAEQPTLTPESSIVQSAPVPTAAPAPAAAPPMVQTARSKATRVAEPDVSHAELNALVAGNNAFAFDLYHRLSAGDEGNLFYSPYGIATVLAMTYAGARGETAAQMADALHFDLSSEQLHPAFNAQDLRFDRVGESDELELNIANALWGQQGYQFRPEFLDTLAENYGAGLVQLDFTQQEGRQHAAGVINGWADRETDGKFPTVVSPDSFGPCTPPGWLCTPLVLTNAIYFKANWAERYDFDESATEDHDFHRLDGSVVKVPMMHQTREFWYVEGKGYQSVLLPYDGHTLAMLILLPEPGQFDEFADSLSWPLVESNRFNGAERTVILTMPRFKLEKDIAVIAILEELGIVNAFDGFVE